MEAIIAVISIDADTDLTTVVTVCSILAGFATIGLAFSALSRGEPVKKTIEETVAKLGKQATVPDEDGSQQNDTFAGTTKQQAALAGGSDFVKALAELAGNLSKVSQAVAALIISTIFFFIAATVAVVEEVDSDDQPKTQMESGAQAGANGQEASGKSQNRRQQGLSPGRP